MTYVPWTQIKTDTYFKEPTVALQKVQVFTMGFACIYLNHKSVNCYQTRSYQNISMWIAVTVMKSAKHSGKWKRFISLNAITTGLAYCALDTEQCWHLLSAFKRREIRHPPSGNMTWNVFVEKWFYAQIRAICISL